MAVPFLNVDGTAANVYPPKYLELALLVLTWMLVSAERSSSAVLRQEFYMELLFASAASTLVLAEPQITELTQRKNVVFVAQLSQLGVLSRRW